MGLLKTAVLTWKWKARQYIRPIYPLVWLQITAIVTGALAVVLGGDGQSLDYLLDSALVRLLWRSSGTKTWPSPNDFESSAVYGACIPIILVCLMYIGLLVKYSQAKHLHTLHKSLRYFNLCLFHYCICNDWLSHWVGKVASIIGLIAFVIIKFWPSRIFQNCLLYATLVISISSFSFGFLANFIRAADYSRYLPTKTSSTRVFWVLALWSVHKFPWHLAY